MKRLMVPPLPAASRPSNRMTMRWPVSLAQACSFSSSTCRRNFSFLVGGTAHQVLVRIGAVTPVIGQLLVGVGQRVHQLLGHLALEGLADDLPVVGRCTLQDGAQCLGTLLHGLLVDVVEDGTDGLDLFS